MLHFVVQGVCRELLAVTAEEEEAKEAAHKATKAELQGIRAVKEPPPHPTRSNTLRERLKQSGRSELVGPKGKERVPFSKLVPMYVGRFGCGVVWCGRVAWALVGWRPAWSSCCPRAHMHCHGVCAACTMTPPPYAYALLWCACGPAPQPHGRRHGQGA